VISQGLSQRSIDKPNNPAFIQLNGSKVDKEISLFSGKYGPLYKIEPARDRLIKILVICGTYHIESSTQPAITSFQEKNNHK
jgi:hypothetical protein